MVRASAWSRPAAAAIDLDALGQPGEDRGLPVLRRAVAELAAEVVPPGQQPAGGRDREPGHVARRNGLDQRMPRQLDVAGPVPLGRAAVTQLAGVIGAPRQHPAGAGQRERAVEAGADGRDLHALRQLDPDGLVVVGGRAGAQLPEMVVAPGQQLAAGGEGQREVKAEPCCRDPDARGQLHPAGREAAGGRAVPELAGGVRAPRIDPARGRHGDGELVGPQGGELLAGRQLHVDRRAAVGSGAVTELAIGVVCPRPRRPGRSSRRPARMRPRRRAQPGAQPQRREWRPRR